MSLLASLWFLERVTLGTDKSFILMDLAGAFAVLGRMISSTCKSHDFCGNFEGGGRDMKSS
jgi:hypothetical protein